MSLERRRLIAVVGMVSEARIIAGPGVVVVISGGRSTSLPAKLEMALGAGGAAVLSFGLCGGLDPDLRPGDLIVGSGVFSDGRWFAGDLAWTEHLASTLAQAERRAIAGVDAFVAGPAQKAALHAATGAAVADTESHVAARFAERHGLPFAAVRAVCDGAKRALPPAALVGLRADGHGDILATVASLGANPGQLPAIIRLALEARAGLRALKGCAEAVRRAS